MKHTEQAAYIWPVLIFAAHRQQILSYADLQGFTGISQVGFSEPLGMIHRYCESRLYPRLNLIVVKRENGLPGEGHPGKEMTPIDILVEQAKVFVFDWSNKEKPSSTDFEGA